MRKSRIIRRVIVALVLLLVATVGAGWWLVRSSVPSLDAGWRLNGLRGPVEIVSDGHGVPHVYARDAEDAWFMAGALHARDRLWQMELYRRAASGRLAEILGETALPIDRRMLTLRIRAAAAAEWSRLRPPARAALERYAEGVNAATATLAGRRRPLEVPDPRNYARRHGRPRTRWRSAGCSPIGSPRTRVPSWSATP